MRVLICGYGAMGQEVHTILLQRGHTVTATVDPLNIQAEKKDLSEQLLADCDAVIEFSHAEAVIPNARRYAAHSLCAVVGTTGWDTKKIRELEISNMAYLYGSNFSIGAHILFSLTKHVARILDNIPEYDIAMSELHHRNKQDSPSGTALSIADTILRNSAAKQTMRCDAINEKIEHNCLHISSTRVGAVPGTHTIYLDSSADSIEITHRARNRSGFALGAVRAVEWLEGKRGIFTTEDFIKDILERR